VTGEESSKRFGGFVLAGGGSTRFGRDKALVEIGDQSLLARLCSVLRGLTPQVQIVGAPKKYSGFGAECIPDRWPGEGPLGGIISALQSGGPAGDREWNLIIGCDMPFLTREWLAYLMERARSSKAEVVAPKSTHGWEPLCGCWRTSAEEKLRHAFESGTRRVTEGMKHLSMEVLDETHWKRFDSADRLFWNMNTPNDYEEVRRILQAEPV
jgi:molybdenum cofactor guanylyltransferase